MKRFWTTTIVAVLCAALSICLCACSSESATSTASGSSEEASAAAEITEADLKGDWEVVAIEAGLETLTGDTLAGIGQETMFSFEDGGKCFADTNGNVVDGTWTLSGDELTMKFGSTTLTATVTPGNITVEGGMTLEPLEEGYQG